MSLQVIHIHVSYHTCTLPQENHLAPQHQALTKSDAEQSFVCPQTSDLVLHPLHTSSFHHSPIVANDEGPFQKDAHHACPQTIENHVNPCYSELETQPYTQCFSVCQIIIEHADVGRKRQFLLMMGCYKERRGPYHTCSERGG